MVIHDLKHPLESVVNQIEQMNNKVQKQKNNLVSVGRAVK